MSMQYAYNYAEIDPNTKMCICFWSTTSPTESTNPNIIAVEVNDPEHIGKYYIDGNWYVDAAGTIPWQSALI